MNVPPVAEFEALVEATDPDADFRLKFLRQAVPALYAGAKAVAGEDREAIAHKLERWRYQLLNKNSPHLSANQQRLADVLDVAAGLARGRPLPPKNPRAALAAVGGITPAETRALTALDSARPLDDIAAAARRQTEEHFATDRWASPGRETRRQSDKESADTSSPCLPVSLSPCLRRRRMVLYAPLYLSSFCVNHCLYCSFRFPQALERTQLTVDEALGQAALLRKHGFRHILLVAGDFPRLTSTDYFLPIIRALTAKGFSIGVEIASQSTLSYRQMVQAGARSLTLYQETFQEDLYHRYHPLGPKTWYDWRLEAPERAADAGVARLGLGILLGLADPIKDLRALIRHGAYLSDRFPRLQLAFSLPRIHEAPAEFDPPCPVDNDLFVRCYCALRLAFPSAELVLSTRESPELRDRLAAICVTQISAGSCTSPGGYGAEATDAHLRQQFPVCDQRSPAEVADMLQRQGLDVLWNIPD